MIVTAEEKKSVTLQKTIVHTLGPEGTNCEKAGYLWLENQGLEGEVRLYGTLEEALVHVKETEHSVLLGCAVYPLLHNVVFENLLDMEIIDSFVMPTYSMVLAAKQDIGHKDIGTIASHPAPAHLAKLFSDNVQLVNSNSQAALDCSSGHTDACITTLKAAVENHLHVVKDFGEVPMCFTIHGLKNKPDMEDDYADNHE
ncbi:hypothetical protein MOE66_10825 [Bacillus atrophaeus]|uniref:hypothetical protein n=1 Tax=Bacillus atrophaeus TaxID=1452 RepID=UPI002281A05D|nr:hypothetical protein [Bacillus atrophaeus]MCY9135177.1 hypothetical protein [Bacillus atrophaeus]